MTSFVDICFDNYNEKVIVREKKIAFEYILVVLLFYTLDFLLNRRNKILNIHTVPKWYVIMIIDTEMTFGMMGSV